MNNIKIRKMNVLPKMSRRYQNKIFYEIRTGKYPKK